MPTGFIIAFHLIEVNHIMPRDKNICIQPKKESISTFNITRGFRQDCILSPIFFNLHLEHALDNGI
jgi:hypothetical protein